MKFYRYLFVYVCVFKYVLVPVVKSYICRPMQYYCGSCHGMPGLVLDGIKFGTLGYTRERAFGGG